MSEIDELEIRKAVKERYSALALGSSNCKSDCCCGNNNENAECGPPLITIGEQVPVEASSINAGCGSPLLLVSPEEGDVVLDLGSGGGIDVFRASQAVGESGRAIGVDSTPEMIWRSRETASRYGEKYKNVEFRLGEIEHLPIEKSSVGYVISNCVINLSPNKLHVFKEAFRVLKPNGVFAVADITVEGSVPEEVRKQMDSWSACVAGALEDSEYKRLLSLAGFESVEVRHVSTSSEIIPTPLAKANQARFYSSHVTARKPALSTLD